MPAKRDTLHLLGDEIRQARKARGWNQDQLAAHCGLHRTFISDVERGVKNPSVLSLEAITTSLQLSISKVFASIERDQRR